MFASLKKNAVKISLTVGAIIIGAMALSFAFPAQVAGTINAVVSGVRGVSASVINLFRRKVDVTVTEMPIETVAV